MTTTRDALYQAALNCPHEIDANRIVLHHSDKQDGHNALAQLANRLEKAAAPMADELESHKRMLGEACHDIGLIHEALGLDPDEAGGAAPILEAIAALLSAHSVEGWKLVPIEPTQDMLDAGGYARTECEDSYRGLCEQCIGDKSAVDAYSRMLAAAPSAPAAVAEGCTPADAQMLRAANHELAAENDKLRRRLRPFAQLATPRLSWAMVEYCIDGDPEKQTLQAPQMQRAFNRAAEALSDETAPTPQAPDAAAEARPVSPPGLIEWLNSEADRHERSVAGRDIAVRQHTETLRRWARALDFPLSAPSQADATTEARATCMCSGLGPCERPGDVSCRIAFRSAAAEARGDAFDGDSEATRAAFRAYDDRNSVSSRTPWQIWRDACAYAFAARASDAGEVASQPPSTEQQAVRDLLPNALWTRHGSGQSEWWSFHGYECRKDGAGQWVVRKAGKELYRHTYLQVVMAHAERVILAASAEAEQQAVTLTVEQREAIEWAISASRRDTSRRADEARAEFEAMLATLNGDKHE